ncbi:hypothetical protein COCC4DRAFT_32484 [Bipolaris maydis ATCC 48331]|uniref:F-box domain-containing protein n=2 Tax=Cochliobolus heterostrophus TaxID=5016 RepID=M2UG03_COCH5|nr:uncharacterized protein COCC4DRAFT_32484 [Bipolaris maydis ATCC 48331]EMD97364.1 hypothetical protein COCHEDRAFT_1086527 [Bipolaris maydis C5]KAH7551284.1 hypothetical protein BM1_09600 [Bipolaris maydis]ENI04180.1 hypothetical protein COCC4DRAFT_32484 [Bipolaris maydis ATCC 48331]KAJ5029780.1 hypothetical protein J3E73DRAFT_407096 [Bipolaris maydis]KAJ5055193.1 hypothetical protein J3E74DRAFT_384360 [Bipolaris maydis]
MERIAYFHTAHTEPIMSTSALWPSDHPNVLRRGSQSSCRSEEMRTLRRPQISSFNRLPTELILKICGHISAHDLWHNIRPTSRLLAICAREVLPRKVFSESNINISWCCFWCSLGRHCLHTACNPITWLFPDAKNVRVALISDRATVAKVIFGDLCNLVTSYEPKVRIRLGDEAQGVRCRSKAIRPRIRPHTADSASDLQSRQEEFVMWYFATQRRQRARSRILRCLGFAAHLLRFFTTSAVLLSVGLTLTLVVYAILEICKLGMSCYRTGRNFMRFCMGKFPLRQ